MTLVLEFINAVLSVKLTSSGLEQNAVRFQLREGEILHDLLDLEVHVLSVPLSFVVKISKSHE